MTGGSLKRWNGSTIKTGGTLRRWNGTGFKSGGIVRRWNGLDFIPAPPTVIVRQNSAEGGSDGVAVTTVSQTGGLSGDKFDQIIGGNVFFSATQKMHGSLSYKMVQTVGNADHLAWGSLVSSNLTEFYTRMYVYYTAYPTTSAVFQRGIDTTTAFIYKLTLSGTSGTPGQIRLYDATNVQVATSAAQLALNTWYRIESHVVVGVTTGRIETRVFPGEATTPSFIVKANGLNTGNRSLDNWSAGANAGGSTPTVPTVYCDDLGLATGYWIGK